MFETWPLISRTQLKKKRLLSLLFLTKLLGRYICFFTFLISWVCPSPSLLFPSSPAVSQGTQLSSLLHLSASCGLRTVASFLLQQPGAREALRATNAQGQTPACVAQDKGHEQLVELFTRWVPHQYVYYTIMSWFNNGRSFYVIQLENKTLITEGFVLLSFQSASFYIKQTTNSVLVISTVIS